MVYQLFQWARLIRLICGKLVSESVQYVPQVTWAHYILSQLVFLWL